MSERFAAARARLLIVLLACASSACTADTTNPSIPIVPTQYMLVPSGLGTSRVGTNSVDYATVGSTMLIRAWLASDAGQRVAEAGRVITWSSSRTDDVFAPAKSITDANGFASTLFTLSRTARVKDVITATDAAGLRGATSEFFTVPGPPVRLTLTTPPSATAVSTVPLAVQPVIQIQDVYGNGTDEDGIPVTVSVYPGEISGTTTVSSDGFSGFAGFSDLALSGAAGEHTLTITARSIGSVRANVTLGGDAPR
jgi:hypothetical protein